MAIVMYSMARVAVFAAAVGVLYLVGMRDWLLVVAAAVISVFISYAALGRLRDRAALQLAALAAARRQRRHVDDDAAAEDHALDGDESAGDTRP